jgi:hypothetical protein
MTIFKIPKVAVYIPGDTSRIRFVPEYCYPLFKRVHSKVADPIGDPVRIVPHPKEVKLYNAYWHEIEADSIEQALVIESRALRAEFGIDAKTNDYLFDAVYGDGVFDAVFAKAYASTDSLKDDPIRRDPADNIADICAEVGLDHKVARKLVATGYLDVEALAIADIDQLSPLVGKVRAGRIIAIATKRIDALIDAGPEAQIAGAKAKAK